MGNKAWKIFPRPLFETVLNHHAKHHPRVEQPLILHGPRGVGKTTLFQDRLLDEWNKGPHLTAYVDFAESIKDHHPLHSGSYPWTSWTNCERPSLSYLQNQLDSSLESMAERGIQLGSISSRQIFTTMQKWHGLTTSLRQILEANNASSSSLRTSGPRKALTSAKAKTSTASLWDRAVFTLSARLNAEELDRVLGIEESGKRNSTIPVEEASYIREAFAALRLAKEVIRVQQSWRKNAVAEMNKKGGFSRSLANSATDWPCLLVELLSQSAEMDFFQPKLVINNIDVLRIAISADDTTVRAPVYHDSLIWRLIALGTNERTLPIILVTTDSYYSYRAYLEFGFIEIFISRENFGWNLLEAKEHMVPDYFSSKEWELISEVIGPSPRHLFEIYALKQSNYYRKILDEKGSTFEDIIDAYLAYLQVTTIKPAMDRALVLLQNFAADARKGKIPKDKLRFGAPWRHPPQSDNPTLSYKWAKIQLLDFVQCYANAKFGVNYLADCSLEIFDDPAALAMIEVGLLYCARDPSFLCPVTPGIERCLVRWLVQERMQLDYWDYIQYRWQRLFRGRYYRHLMKQL
uniref:Uncharacterized protein n=1 Tax=Kalanchoe fedtschenkoi TaxID=63787 RepID=A0A7N0SXC5_KALFE